MKTLKFFFTLTLIMVSILTFAQTASAFSHNLQSKFLIIAERFLIVACDFSIKNRAYTIFDITSTNQAISFN